MRRLHPILIVLLAAGSLAVGATGAYAESAVLKECPTGKLTQHFSVAQLQQALATLPASTQEYTNCYEVISAQLNAELGKTKVNPGTTTTTTTTSSGGSFLSTPLLIVLIVVVIGGVGFAIRSRGRGPSGPEPPAQDSGGS